VLPENFPGIKFNEGTICQHCQRHGQAASTESLKQKYRDKLSKVIREVRSRAAFDVMVSYSGGKDSSYTLKLLKQEYDLNILAVTFNHGFLSSQALKNAETVTRALNIDHLMFTPGQEALYRAFRNSMDTDLYSLKELQRASSICLTCMHLIKSFILKCSFEMNIPLIAYGWSPGQVAFRSAVVPLNSAMIQQMQKAVARTLRHLMGNDLKPFVLGENHFGMPHKEGGKAGGFPLFSIHPLAVLPYHEENILAEIGRLGWQAPADTDSNSTNCLLNGLANQVHVSRYGFHPYAYEIAGLVRNGWMDREAGFQKLAAPLDEDVVRYVRMKLRTERGNSAPSE
jgi:hypothetical protein